MTVSGDSDLLAKIEALDNGMQKDARAAIRDGAEIFANALKTDTPVWSGETDDPTHMRDDIHATGVRDRGGILESDVGYGQQTGFRVHFPNNGTAKQDPQHFVEETQEKTRDEILEAFVSHLKVGG
ncbi:HK97-gp10 family putative phage morphogenesis protein [Lacticaseibacillus salsurivasis]|uniref:HK97-gp10 family putative phage morphogenesis protein n=1 Tax=Lacticaseibacillus salsurivasis TaxID=3081441 RepID=UPI0030C77D8F